MWNTARKVWQAAWTTAAPDSHAVPLNDVLFFGFLSSVLVAFGKSNEKRTSTQCIVHCLVHVISHSSEAHSIKRCDGVQARNDESILAGGVLKTFAVLMADVAWLDGPTPAALRFASTHALVATYGVVKRGFECPSISAMSPVPPQGGSSPFLSGCAGNVLIASSSRPCSHNPAIGHDDF